MLRIPCPNCSTKLKAPETAIGRRARCGKCNTRFIIEAPAAPELPNSTKTSGQLFNSTLDSTNANSNEVAEAFDGIVESKAKSHLPVAPASAKIGVKELENGSSESVVKVPEALTGTETQDVEVVESSIEAVNVVEPVQPAEHKYEQGIPKGSLQDVESSELADATHTPSPVPTLSSPTDEDRESLRLAIDSLKKTLKPVKATGSYRLMAAFVALTMLALPVMYVVFIGLIGWGTWQYAVHGYQYLVTNDARGRVWVLYVAPIIAAAFTILFMFKPFFARSKASRTTVILKAIDQPLLFHYIAGICRSLKAPVPKRIEVMSDVNASASFSNGWLSLFRPSDLTLTIGMPLVHATSVQELTAIIAHEFGHFSQGSAMRLNWIISHVNAWFARIVYERDQWDERLARWRENYGIQVSLILWVATLAIAFSRLVLWFLMMIGHAVSCALSRQMEFDADKYAYGLVGSDAFTSMSAKIDRLAVAEILVNVQLEQFAREGKRVKDITKLPVAQIAKHSNEISELLTESEKKTQSNLFSTHPAWSERVQAAKLANSPGLFLCDVPSICLFSDSEALGQELTEKYYPQWLGDDYKQLSAVESSDLEQFSESDRKIRTANTKYFGDQFIVTHPIELTSSVAGELSQMSVHEAWAQIEKAIDAGRDTYFSDLKELSRRTEELEKIEAVLGVQNLNVKVDVGYLKSIDLPTKAELSQYSRESQQATTALREKIRHHEGLIAKQIGLAHALLSSSSLETINDREILNRRFTRAVDCLRQLNSSYEQFHQLRMKLSFVFIGLGSVQKAKQTPAIEQYLVACFSRARQALSDLVEGVKGKPYPFEHAKADIDLAAYLCPILPPDNPEPNSEALQIAVFVLSNFRDVYNRCLGQLTSIIDEMSPSLASSSIFQSSVADLLPTEGFESVATTSLSGSNTEMESLPTLAIAGDFQPSTTATWSGTQSENLTNLQQAKEPKTNSYLVYILGGVLIVGCICSGIAAYGLMEISRAISAPVTSVQNPDIAAQKELLAGLTIAEDATLPLKNRRRRQLLYRINEIPSVSVAYSIKVSDISSGAETPLYNATYILQSQSAPQPINEFFKVANGFVVHPDGFIATSANLVQTAKKIEVVIDGKKFPSQLVAVDSEQNLALLKIAAKGLISLPILNSPSLQPGDSMMVLTLESSTPGALKVLSKPTTCKTAMEESVNGKRFYLNDSLTLRDHGCPVLEKTGKVIGMSIVTATPALAVEESFVVPIESIQALLKSIGAAIDATVQVSSGPSDSTNILSMYANSVVQIESDSREVASSFSIGYTAFDQSEFATLQDMQNLAHERAEFTLTKYGVCSPSQSGGRIGRIRPTPSPLHNFPWLLFENLHPSRQESWGFTRYYPNLQTRAGGRIPPTALDPRSVVNGKQTNGAPVLKEETKYKLVTSSESELIYEVKRSLAFTDDPTNPSLRMESSGEWRVNAVDGMPISLNETIVTSRRDSPVQTLKLNYERVSDDGRTIEALKKENFERQKGNSDRLQQLQTQFETIPNAETVEGLLRQLEPQEKTQTKTRVLEQLSQVATVDELRNQVLERILPFVFPAADKFNIRNKPTPNSIAAYCHWASDTEIETLEKIKSTYPSDFEIDWVNRKLKDLK